MVFLTAADGGYDSIAWIHVWATVCKKQSEADRDSVIVRDNCSMLCVQRSTSCNEFLSADAVSVVLET